MNRWEKISAKETDGMALDLINPHDPKQLLKKLKNCCGKIGLSFNNRGLSAGVGADGRIIAPSISGESGTDRKNWL